MTQTVASHVGLRLYGDADLIFSVAVADGHDVINESVQITQAGQPLEHQEISGRHGARLFRAAGTQGDMTLDYAATVRAPLATVADELELIEYGRPSRYCESDALYGTIRQQFAGLTGRAAVDAVADWVRSHLSYVPGSSTVTDGAVATYDARRGVCRDYAHLVIAATRALDIPARLVSVYAPDLVPMDFHAVAEVFVDGQWLIVDATDLAPIDTMVRIATGRDAADTAFLTKHGAAVDLLELQVSASVSG